MNLRRVWLTLFLTWLVPLTADARLPEHTPVPGGIAVLTIPDSFAAKDAAPIAKFNGNRVLVTTARDDKNAKWVAVVGIPLSLTPGPHVLDVNGQQLTFKVADKQYREQHITLKNKRQVNPLKQDLERIARERQEMNAAFRHWNPALKPGFQFIMPVEGPLSSPFGLQRFFNGEPRNPHSGLDIAAAQGTAIKAPLNARVAATGNYFFNGNTVLLDHGQGLVSMYCHMDSIAVKRGTLVKAGDLLGTVGKTGRATGPHLHWSVSLNNARIDPLLLTGTGPQATP